MSIVAMDDADGVVTIRLTGRLSEADTVVLENTLASIIRDRGMVGVLVVAENFHGWEHGDWDSFALQEQTDPYIRRMAIVGERQWEDSALMFAAKGLRPFPIEYFVPEDLEGARAWVAAAGR